MYDLYMVNIVNNPAEQTKTQRKHIQSPPRQNKTKQNAIAITNFLKISLNMDSLIYI